MFFTQIGGDPNAFLLDRLRPLALPRQCLVCPGGYRGLADPKFAVYAEKISVVTLAASKHADTL